MVRNILNELTARGVRHLIISALFFVVYALCGTAIMLTVYFSSTVIYKEKASLSFRQHGYLAVCWY